MKKISVIMAAVLLLGAIFCAPVYARYSSDEWTKVDGVDFAYHVIDNKYAAITSGRHFVPDQVDGYPVTIIDDLAFVEPLGFKDKDSSPKDWVIPETVTYIGERAFCENKELKTVKIPSSVTYIGEAAFANCPKLKKVNIPESVKEIKPYTFFECKKLSDITLHDDIEKIGDYAFFGCRALSGFKAPANLHRIGDRAFYLCTSLKSIDFSGSDPSKIGYQSLGYYNTYSGDKGQYFLGRTIPEKTTKKYKNFKIITDDIIGDYENGPAWYAEKNNFKYLVYTPSWAGKLGDRAFYLCTSLKSIDFRGQRTVCAKISRITELQTRK